MTIQDGNIGPLKKSIEKGVKKIDDLKKKRTGINDAIAEVRSSLAAEGIPKKCLDMAMQYMNMDEDKRLGFDTAYSIVREALGAPVQADLFEEKAAGDKKTNVTSIDKAKK